MDFARNERGFCVGFAWNLILFSFVHEREGYKHHADCTVVLKQFRIRDGILTQDPVVRNPMLYLMRQRLDSLTKFF